MLSSIGPSLVSQSPIRMKHIDIGISDEKLNEIEIMMGPETNEADRFIVKKLLVGLDESVIIDNYFKGKIKSK